MSHQQKARSTRSKGMSKATPSKKSTPAKKVQLDRNADVYEACIKGFEESKRESARVSLKDLKELDKKFKNTVDATKRETQILDHQLNQKRKAGTTRSGTVRGTKKQPTHCDGKWVNKGMDEASEPLDEDDQEYLAKRTKKAKKVSDLKLDDIRYIIMYVILDDLKSIKEGTLISEFHSRYMELLKQGRPTTELFSDIYTSLFTNEQRDYINGLLQGAFDLNSKDSNGDIKHKEMNYVNTVILAEAIIRLIKHIHKFETIEETTSFMKKSAIEALGGDFEQDN